jgi:iron complex transport system substrate-binding protein
VTGQERLPYPQFSVEEAVVRRPDLIVLARHGETPEQEPLHRWPSLSVLPAVRQGRVGSIDGNLLHKPGPRVVDGLRALARLLHPDLPW